MSTRPLCLPYAHSQQLRLLDQLANIRVALFHYNPPLGFATSYLLSRLFKFMPESLYLPVAPTREFWMHVMESKINATIRNEGDMIGWEDDNETVGPVALAAKGSLLRAIPHLMPPENVNQSLYRLVLEHGDFGIHNTTITKEANGEPLVTSLYDWETGCFVPAILSDPLVAAGPVDLITDENAGPSVTRIPKDATLSDLETYAVWARHYIKVRCSPPLLEVIRFAQINDNFPSHRRCTIRRLTTKLLYRLERMYGTYGSRYETGGAEIRKISLAVWDNGPKCECENWVLIERELHF